MYITKTAVIGAGTMGGEIAYLFTTIGLPVVLKDIDKKYILTGMDKARSLYQRYVDKGKITARELEAKMELITPALNYDPFTDVDFVVEAVPEDIEMKKKVFAELDGILQPQAIITSNTSALSITMMADATRRPDRVAGMHFFNPPAIMRLVEVIKGRDTGEKTVETVADLCKKLRKLPVIVNECPGFVVNRILCFALREAMLISEELGSGEEVFRELDAAMVSNAGGMPMGPFTLADQLGLNLSLKVIRILEQGYGSRFSPPKTLVELVKAGNLGAGTGRGFYGYGEQKPAPVQPPAELNDRQKAAVDRILLAAVAESLRLVEENVAAVKDVDLAMLSGAGFQNQPFKWADEIGLDVVFNRLKTLAGELGDRFSPADTLGEMSMRGELGKKTGKGFYVYTGDQA